MLAALRQQQRCHLRTPNTIRKVLENTFEPCFSTATPALKKIIKQPIKKCSIRHCRQLSTLRLDQVVKNRTPLQCTNRNCHKQKQIKLNVNFRRTSLPDSREGSYGSRFFPPTQFEIAEEKIKESLSSKSLLISQEWADTKTDLMDTISMISEINFSSIVMNSLLALNKVNEAHALLKYLREANIEINFLAYLTYMDLCARNVDQCGQEVILDSFKKVKSFMDASPVIDLKGAEHLIQGLCATDQWRLSLEYVKKMAHKPNMPIKNCLACAAIRNSDEALAGEILAKWLRADEHPSDRVFKELFRYALKLQCHSERRSEVFLMKVLEYIRWKGCVVSKEVAQLIEEVFRCHSSKWQFSYTKVSRNGECESCMKSLRVVDFTEEDFAYLKKSFLEKSLKKSDLFINSTEKEFDQYIKFVTHNKPFDIVLDGLNAAHTFAGKKNPKSLSFQLLKVVQKLYEPPKKLLVLGKHHMRAWPRSTMQKICDKAKLFLTNNISQDDPFMVYAALVSGPHSQIVSSDLMRDHMSRLDDPVLIRHFKRWQQTHQIYLTVADDNELEFVKPLRHSINIQGSMKDGWHIPFDDNIALEPYEELNNWLCIQKVE